MFSLCPVEYAVIMVLTAVSSARITAHFLDKELDQAIILWIHSTFYSLPKYYSKLTPKDTIISTLVDTIAAQLTTLPFVGPVDL